MAQEKMKTFCVYKHTAPDGRAYIGITSQKPEARWQSGSGYRGNSYFTRAIKKYGWNNFEHFVIFDNLSEEDAKSIEIELIRILRTNERKYGFNISSGGESKKGTKISEWQKQRIREANIGKVVAQETRDKLSVATKRTWANPDHVRKLRELNLGEKNPQYGKVQTPEEKLMRGAKPVVQYDMFGNYIAEYISCHEANNVTGINRESISNCCRGNYKQAGGFIWRYKS